MNPIKIADYISVGLSRLAGSFSPVVMPVPGRPVDMELRVAVPAQGGDVPVILLSHGHGSSNFLSSRRGYAPLVDFYAAHGFAVIQPTHLDSRTLGLPTDGPEGAIYWKSRVTDMRFILDHLDRIEAAVPGLAGRLDRERVAAVGHSLGGHTVAMLAGMRAIDPVNGKAADFRDARVKACVILAAPGDGEGLAASAAERYPVLATSDFAAMTTPALVVAGDADVSAAFSERKDWRCDAYHSSPSPKCLLTLFGAKHQQGGISGYDAAETSDENPERASLVQRLTWAYLRTALYAGDPSWPNARAALEQQPTPLGSIACK